MPENLSLTGSLRLQKTVEQQPDTTFLAVADEEELYRRGLDDVIADLEKRLISHALTQSGNSKTKAAEMLRVSFRSLRYKTKKYQLD